MRGLTIPWLTLFALGAAHGVNPAMGWLFAVGRGLQERDRRAMWRALGPLALGHALAVGAAVLLAATLGQVLPPAWLRWLVAAALLAVGVDALVGHRHVRLGGVRVTARELTTWSFLAASAHGAGLMVLPLVLGTAAPSASAAHHHHLPLAAGVVAPDASGIAGPVVHTLGYVAATVVLAVVVYEKVGLRILRRAWINLNAIWAASLLLAAIAVVAL